MADFGSHLDAFRDADVKLVVLSSDDREHAREIREKHELQVPVGYDVDAVTFARATGCFYNDEDDYLHANAYIVRPDGTIASAVYASGAVGRLRAEEALEQVKFFRDSD